MRNKRPKDPFETFVRAVLTLGANPLMKKAGFKRPGGGWRYYRERPWTERSPWLDEVSVGAAGWTVGHLTLRLALSAQPHVLVCTHRFDFPVDLLGDSRDLAVWVHHWLRSEALPWFERPLDLEAVARETEATELRPGRSDWAVRRVAGLWRLAGRPEEAARVEVEPPVMCGDGLPF
ncbi:MAG: hypothetical protein JNJ54_36595 [Myxococcaceae bacterium]|nr:hypothetical protein [Myxococcaceae bacterium]